MILMNIKSIKLEIIAAVLFFALVAIVHAGNVIPTNSFMYSCGVTTSSCVINLPTSAPNSTVLIAIAAGGACYGPSCNNVTGNNYGINGTILVPSGCIGGTNAAAYRSSFPPYLGNSSQETYTYACNFTGSSSQQISITNIGGSNGYYEGYTIGVYFFAPSIITDTYAQAGAGSPVNIGTSQNGKGVIGSSYLCATSDYGFAPLELNGPVVPGTQVYTTATGEYNYNTSIVDLQADPCIVNSSTPNTAVAISEVGIKARIPPLQTMLCTCKQYISAEQSVRFYNTTTGGTGSNHFVLSFNVTNGIVQLANGNYTFNNPGNYLATLTVTDLSNDTASNSMVIHVTPALVTMLYANKTSVQYGQSIELTNTTTGGTGNNHYAYTVNSVSGFVINNNIINFTAVGTYNITLDVRDLSGEISNSSLIINVSSQAQSILSPPGGGGGGSSGGSYSGGGSQGSGGGGGNFVPTLTKANNGGDLCYLITNFSQDNSESINFNNLIFKTTENYINPNGAGISVNGTAYQFSIDNSITLLNTSKYEYSITLEHISYLPIAQSITVELCGLPKSVQEYLSSQPPTVNLTITNGIIIAATSINNNIVGIFANGNLIISANGLVKYNESLLSAGTYNLTAKDITADVYSASKSVSKDKLKPSLNFTYLCSNYIYSNSSISCTTKAQIITINNQLSARLLLNNQLVGITSNMISNTVSTPGSYRYVFATSGNANYTNASINYTYVVNSNAIDPKSKQTTTKLSPALIGSFVAIALAIAFGMIFVGGKRRKKKPAKKSLTSPPS